MWGSLPVFKTPLRVANRADSLLEAVDIQGAGTLRIQGRKILAAFQIKTQSDNIARALGEMRLNPRRCRSPGGSGSCAVGRADRLAMWPGARIVELCSLRVGNVHGDRIDIKDAEAAAGPL